MLVPRLFPTVLAILMTLCLALPAAAGDSALTLQDPAATTTPAAPMPEWLAYQDPYAKANKDIATAHLSHADVTAWTMAAVTEALTIPHTDYEQKLTEQRGHFTDKGWSEYGRFLQDSRAMNVLQGGQNIATVADGEALVVNHGEQQGHYRWVVSLPVMQSVSTTTGHRQTLMIEVMRVAMPANAEAPDLRIDGIRSAAAAPTATIGTVPSQLPSSAP